MNRLEIATRILAGFAANPAVFAENGMCGWKLVNCIPKELAEFSLEIADELIEANKIAGESGNEVRE